MPIEDCGERDGILSSDRMNYSFVPLTGCNVLKRKVFIFRDFVFTVGRFRALFKNEKNSAFLLVL